MENWSAKSRKLTKFEIGPVAVTQAKNELYITYPKIASRAGPGGMMLSPSRFLLELSNDLYDELRIKRSYEW